VSSIGKLIARMRRNPRQVRYEELLRVLRHLGWREVEASGSHRRFDASDGSAFVIVVRPHGGRTHCHPRDVLDVLVWVPSGDEDDRPAV
jgi:predicted RNA binding protein YcfA (HicA-like mRNA interferase family)